MGPLESMKKHYEQRDVAARKWKKQGGKVIGYISDDCPEEMILAAGLFPFRVSGDPASGTAETDKYTESFYDPSVRSILNMLLTGKYDFLDYLVIPHASDSILKLYHQLWWIHRVDPAKQFPPVHLFDIVHTRFWKTGQYVRDQVRVLKEKLEEWSGKKITASALARAIAIGNENKALLKQVAALRASEPAHLSGVEALQIIGSSMVMLKEEHNKLLSQFLKGASQLPSREGVRLFVEGSDLDNPQFYELVESCDATIVGENSSWGNRYSEDPVDPSGDPFEAIAERYHLRPSRPRIQSIEQRVTYCVRSALEAKAQGVIFFLYEWDPAPSWDQPDQAKALEDKGIPSFPFNMQKYAMSDQDRKTLKKDVEQFVASLSTKKKQ